MVENIISQLKLEAIIVDLIQNAIIAIESGQNPFRSVLVALGIASEHYELTVFDSGVKFSIDTIMRLGVQRITTHADEGGVGIGFMSTFEIMREHDASFIIKENPVSDSDFTKSITIRFDGMGRFIIKTYRDNKFPKHSKRGIEIINA